MDFPLQNIILNIAILIVEDNPDDVSVFKAVLSVGNTYQNTILSFKVFDVDNIDDAKLPLNGSINNNTKFDLILLDLNLKGFTDLNEIENFVQTYKSIPVIIHTEIYDLDLAFRCIRMGAQDYLVKQFTDASQLIHSISHSIQRHAVFNKTGDLLEKLEQESYDHKNG